MSQDSRSVPRVSVHASTASGAGCWSGSQPNTVQLERLLLCPPSGASAEEVAGGVRDSHEAASRGGRKVVAVGGSGTACRATVCRACLCVC